jgi:oligopeptide transport system substrate-binding protein
MTYLSIRLLGSFQVTLDGERVVGFDSDKVRALLAYLAVEDDRQHRREKLAGFLWPDYAERSARTNLRRALANLRQVIADQQATPAFLDVTPRTIQFNPKCDYWLDVTAFTALVEGKAGIPPDIDQLEEAVSLYKGIFLEGFSIPDSSPFEEWALLTKEWLQREAIAALHHLAEFYEELGEFEQALLHTRRQIELEPLKEDAYIQMMRILALSGRRSEALAQYDSLRHILAKELDIEPTKDTIALYEQVRSGEFGSVKYPTKSFPVIPSLPPVFLKEKPQQKMDGKPVFVARERELSKLDTLLGMALSGHGRVVFVTGGAGRGKTALLREFVRRSLDTYPELLVAIGHCSAYSGVGDPYSPFREIMGMLTGDVETKWLTGAITRENACRLWEMLPYAIQVLMDQGSELIDIFVPSNQLMSRAVTFARTQKTSQMIDSVDWLTKLESICEKDKLGYQVLEQAQIFQQFVAVLTSLAINKPLLILLDDLQWADAASISLLFHLGRSIGGSRIMIAGAYRPDEVSLGRDGERHPLEQVLSEFKRRFGDVWVDLAVAEKDENRKFVDALLDTTQNRLGEDFRQALFQRTEGHPLFTIELLQAMQERGSVVQDEDGWWVERPILDWASLPVRVEGVIEERIERLNLDLREILRVASVEGEVFTVQVVAHVLEISVRKLLWELSQELEKRHRLVREIGEIKIAQQYFSRFQFNHTMFQQYLYDSLSASEKRLLHGTIATKLEDLYKGRTDDVAVQLARHFTKARQVDRAIHYLLRAGDQASRFYAHQEAIKFYQRALTFLMERGEYELAARTLMKLGLTYHNAFDFQEARQAYQEGFVFWQRMAEEKRSAPDSLPPAPHSLRVTGVEPKTLGLGQFMDFPSRIVVDQIFSGLVEMSSEMEVVPDVARSWDVFDGGRKYVFHLRADVYWSDGVQVTAQDFEYSWKWILDPAGTQRWQIYLFDIKNAMAYHRGEITNSNLVGVRALDDFTLSVELDGPTSYLPYLLAFVSGYPMPRHVVKVHGDAWAEVENIVTNGPFRLVSWERGETLVLERNPTYHGRLTGNVERVECEFLSEQTARFLQSYKQNNLDIFDWLPLAEFASSRQLFAGDYVSGPCMSTNFFGFDVSRPPFNDQRVRCALAMATDRETLADVILRGYAFPATGGFVPPEIPGHSADIGLPYDPEAARLVLAKAGYPGGRGFPVIECLVRDDPGHDLACEYLQAQWLEILGIEINWKQIRWGSFYDLLSKQAPPMWMVSWYADYPDPDNILRIPWWLSIGGWENHTYTKLVEGARRVLDQAERMRMYQEADKILVEEAVLLPLWYGRFHMLVKPWVKKLFTSPLKWWSWKDIIIEDHSLI